MDPNRNEEEGAQGRPLAQWAYHEFHGKIAQVRKNNKVTMKLAIFVSVAGYIYLQIKALILNY